MKIPIDKENKKLEELVKPSLRHKARYLAVQAVYRWQFGTGSVEEIYDNFNSKSNPKKVDVKYFTELLNGVAQNQTIIDEQIKPFLDRAISELDRVELAILRIATYELMFRSDVPCKVVINEALELTKTFGSKDGFKYINGVLDNIAKKAIA
jgi:transcription antitermination protein NusB